ncbi:spore coat protein [Bacillus mojavensis]|uniref:spore coat protein n=1 Tax=Bacillus mojavensis TaxID=72360 RepID=UPI002DBA358B|nr:spore coat protein [Bacillus mojavensis]MEC1612769.1 spore coat protein [Bacillus mojavensis]MEC1622842.1 spore coat protein [Bacillus mojavensis]MEC1659222.1 spore coat protein [Bacillus mojavensis]MEC1691348.1 spore coat protein [Bacillus mojavensis]
MNEFFQKIAGMGSMTEQVIATDFLISAKTGVRNIAAAITESSSPEVRETLQQYLHDAINTHEQIFLYMAAKGFYHSKDLTQQICVDLEAADTAKDLPQI